MRYNQIEPSRQWKSKISNKILAEEELKKLIDEFCKDVEEDSEIPKDILCSEF